MTCVYVGTIKDTHVSCSVCSYPAIKQYTELSLCDVCVGHLGTTLYRIVDGLSGHIPMCVDDARRQLRQYRDDAYLVTAYLRVSSIVIYENGAGSCCAYCDRNKPSVGIYKWKLPPTSDDINHWCVRGVCILCHNHINNTVSDIRMHGTKLILYARVIMFVDIQPLTLNFAFALIAADAINAIKVVNNKFIMPVEVEKK